MARTYRHKPTRRSNRWLVLLPVVLVLALAAVAGYLARRPEPRTAADIAAPAASASTPVPDRSSAPTTSKPATRPASPSRPPSAEQEGPRAPDSAVDPHTVFVDPAGSGAATPAPAGGTPPTCRTWRTLMTDDERASYAASLLQAARRSESSSTVTARDLQSAISDACADPDKADSNVPDVARAVHAARTGN